MSYPLFKVWFPLKCFSPHLIKIHPHLIKIQCYKVICPLALLPGNHSWTSWSKLWLSYLIWSPGHSLERKELSAPILRKREQLKAGPGRTVLREVQEVQCEISLVTEWLWYAASNACSSHNSHDITLKAHKIFVTSIVREMISINNSISTLHK